MSTHKIKPINDPVLRKKSHPVTKIDERVRKTLKEMAETMYAHQGGGLAACQVGILRRLVVIDMGDCLYQLVNPEIIAAEGEQLVTEGCLSLPDVWGKLKRPAKVTVKALDPQGKPLTITATGSLAKCFCHELDHLDGVLFTDHVIEYVKKP